MKRLLPLLILGASMTLAHAHAFLDHAEPKVGSTVAAPPAKVTIWFTEAVNAKSTRIAIFDAAGKEVDAGDSKIDANDDSKMTVTLPKMPAGLYKVQWAAVCRAGHHTSGDFTFTVSR